MFGHQVTIQPKTGKTAAGPTYGSPFTVQCRVNGGRRMARSPSQVEVTNQTTIYLPHDTDCPIGSRITLPDGRPSTVVAVHPRNGGSLPTPVHLEVVVE